MDQRPAITQNLMDNWNGYFPNNELTAADLKSAYKLMGAVFEVFDRLGINREAVIAPSEEALNDHTVYFHDLIPVINMTRVINHLVKAMPNITTTIYITHFLQPVPNSSRAILLLLLNLMVFHEQHLNDIAPYEEELFSIVEQVQALKDRKNELLAILNEQAEEKGKREERLEKLRHETKMYEEELNGENEAYEAEKNELNTMLKNSNQMEMLLEQKKAYLDLVLADIEKKRALIVYDEEDVRAQLGQAARQESEAEGHVGALTATLTEKETCLKNLQTTKSNLDLANVELEEIIKLTDCYDEYESCDVEGDIQEGELNILKTELSDLEAQFAELRATRGENHARQQDAAAVRLHKMTKLQSDLRNAEEKDKKNQELYRQGIQQVDEIKELTKHFEEEQNKYCLTLETIKQDFEDNLQLLSEAIINQVLRAEKRINDKLQNRRR